MNFENININQKVETLSLKRNRRLNNLGMTLIEIVLVLTILGGLFAMIIPKVMDQFGKAKYNEAKVSLKQVATQIEMYNSECQSYPRDFNDMITNPGAEVCANWGPKAYLPSIPKDPWGTPLIYEVDGTSYHLRSLGKDKKEGGEGYAKDITSDDLAE